MWAVAGAAAKGYALSALAFLRGLPRDAWYAAAIAALLFNTYGHVNKWFVHWEGWKPKAVRLQTDLNTVLAAQIGAKAKALVQNKRVESATTNLATESDDEHTKDLVHQLDAAERFIATHRVRSSAAEGVPGGSSTATQGGDPGVLAGLSADTFVAVPDTDVRACTADATYAVNAHNWAMKINTVIQSSAAAVP